MKHWVTEDWQFRRVVALYKELMMFQEFLDSEATAECDNHQKSYYKQRVTLFPY